MWSAIKGVGQRLALLGATYFGSSEIISHSAYKEYVDAALAITAAVWTGYETYSASKKNRELLKARDAKEKKDQAALAERDLKQARARTWKKASRRNLYKLADLRKEYIAKVCEKGLKGYPKKSPVERDDEFRTRFGLWLPPVDKYITMDIDVSEEIRIRAEKLKQEMESVAVC
ncbi:MAG: hypothetical protein QXD77_02845 [Candidatus Aenigmatarchaeota archaeon]